ncbi:MAG: hypothetical protein Q4B28_03620 [bacterium]|nr:hypothetical protein [bacterium]
MLFTLLMSGIALVCCVIVLYPFEQVQAPTPLDMELMETAADEVSYDQQSRKEVIAQDCQAFFDGCNHCMRMGADEAACTKKYCESYQKPVCTDEDNQHKHPDLVPVCDASDPLSQCQQAFVLE